MIIMMVADWLTSLCCFRTFSPSPQKDVEIEKENGTEGR